MDESLIRVKLGRPVPEWDMQHRLSTDRPVGPDLWDGGTIFGINSTYMDVTEQPFMERQWTTLGTVLSLSGTFAAWWGYHLIHTPDGEALSFGTHVAFYAICLVALFAFGRLAYLGGHTVFFALKNRPIRFNRKAKKIFAVRRRRFFRKPGEGDVVTEVDWDKNSAFCIHRTQTNFGRVYHIRCYKLDAAGNVLDAFSIGREWQGDRNVRTLLAQWNYWCKYMNEGPQDLPKPMLFMPTRETMSDTFFFGMYTLGMSAGGTERVITMPFTLLFTALRALSLATCRAPIWPDSLRVINCVDPDDAYAEPSGRTPVGWAQTIRAHLRGEYPESPRGEVPNWNGSKDGVENAQKWVRDRPPKELADADVGAGAERDCIQIEYDLAPDETNVGDDMVAVQRELASVTEHFALPEGVPHNLACLDTLRELDLFDDLIYEQTKKFLPDSPNFEKDGEQSAVGGPAALLQWMVDEDLLGRTHFEALAERYFREGVARKKNEKDDLHRMLIVLSVKPELCVRAFGSAMSRKKMRAYIPYVASGVVLICSLYLILH